MVGLCLHFFLQMSVLRRHFDTTGGHSKIKHFLLNSTLNYAESALLDLIHIAVFVDVIAKVN